MWLDHLLSKEESEAETAKAEEAERPGEELGKRVVKATCGTGSLVQEVY